MEAPLPPGLTDRSAAVWRSVTADYELNAVELRILDDACREMDLIDRLEADAAGVESIVMGSMKQEVANPLFAELRQHRTALAGLFKALKLPEEGGTGSGSASDAGRTLVSHRWGRGA